MRIVLIVVLAGIIVSPPGIAVGLASNLAAGFQSAPSEGLDQFLASLQTTVDETTASRKANKLTAALEEMRIPNYEKWFVDTFGSENGPVLSTKYTQTNSRAEKRLTDYFAGNAPAGGKIGVEPIPAQGEQKNVYQQNFDDAVQKSLKQPTVFYRLQYIWINPGSGNPVKYTMGYLTPLGGRYCIISDFVLRELPGVPALRIRQGGAVTAAALLNRVQPVYPDAARKSGTAGTVRLHAIIGKDGAIQNLEVISGEPVLVEAALDAVRQWRYRPTLLDGNPVEVDTVIDVVFSLGR